MSRHGARATIEVAPFSGQSNDGSFEAGIVEGRPGRTGIGFFRLDASGEYQAVQPDAQGRYHSEVLPGFWFDPAWFEQDPLPNPLQLLKVITPEGWDRFLGE